MFTVEAIVRGYHVCRKIWGSFKRERGNLVDLFAVIVLENGDVVGYLLQKILPISFTFP